MKALLVFPALRDSVESPILIQDEDVGTYPPLGLIYVASYLHRHTSHVAAIVDAQAEQIDDAAFARLLETEQPDVVGIHAMTYTWREVLRLARRIKAVDQSIRVVIGGPHTAIYPLESASRPEIDFVVVGEGEITFAELLDALAEHRDPATVPGLALKTSSGPQVTPPRELVANLDLLPFPDRTLTPWRRYFNPLGTQAVTTTMITSRGCPNRCIYCFIQKRPVRLRSVDNVVEEFRSIAALGIKEVYVCDETFNLHRDRTIELSRRLIAEELGLQWGFRGRVDHIDEETLRLLKKAGCLRIQFGVESGVDRVLKAARKGTTVAQVEEAFRLCRKVGITTVGYFMIGLPTESAAEAEETVRFSRRLAPDYVIFSITTPLPGTDLYQLGLSQGLLAEDVWRRFVLHPEQPFVPPYWLETMTAKQLERLSVRAYRQFYLRPGYVLHRLLHLRSLTELSRLTRAGISVLRSAA